MGRFTRLKVQTTRIFPMLGCLHNLTRLPVVTVAVPFTRRLGPHHVSHANVHWLSSRQGRQLIGQEMLLHHSVVVAAMGMNFPVERAEDE